MNRRTCACGTAIVCASLDGYPVWVDEHEDGWLTLDQDGRAALGPGPWRRHTCAHDPRPVDLGSDKAERDRLGAHFADHNALRTRNAAARDIAAARTVLNSGQHVTAAQRRAAELRIANPALSVRQIAANHGLHYASYAGALKRVRRHAEQITSSTT